jgi:hypothetical protein
MASVDDCSTMAVFVVASVRSPTPRVVAAIEPVRLREGLRWSGGVEVGVVPDAATSAVPGGGTCIGGLAAGVMVTGRSVPLTYSDDSKYSASVTRVRHYSVCRAVYLYCSVCFYA